jgi:hypothetical protein
MTKYVTEKQLEERISWVNKNLKSYVEHNTMSEETEKAINSLDNRIVGLEATVKEKVGFKHFYWIIGIMMTLLMTTVGYLIDQIHDLQRAQYEVAREVSEISGSLSSIEFINITND